MYNKYRSCYVTVDASSSVRDMYMYQVNMGVVSTLLSAMSERETGYKPAISQATTQIRGQRTPVKPGG